MKITNYHEGDRSEYLAEYALSTIGHCIKVPRQDDHFGTDFIVHLFTPDSLKTNTLKPSGVIFIFAIQIKSNLDPIVIKENDMDSWFKTFMMPFLIRKAS